VQLRQLVVPSRGLTNNSSNSSLNHQPLQPETKSNSVLFDSCGDQLLSRNSFLRGSNRQVRPQSVSNYPVAASAANARHSNDITLSMRAPVTAVSSHSKSSNSSHLLPTRGGGYQSSQQVNNTQSSHPMAPGAS